jgi:hypothetical protein
MCTCCVLYTHQAVSTDPASAGDLEHDVHFPPVEVNRALGPDRAFLAAQRRRQTHILTGCYRVCKKEQLLHV